MDVERKQNSLKGDRALGKGETDRLGFREIAARIAISLVDHASDEGLVIGLDGSWGSGKSSLLFLVQDELERLPEVDRPTIINFRPWLVGNRDVLLSSLFSEFASGLDRVHLARGDATGATITKAKAAAEIVRKFAARLTPMGEIIKTLGNLAPIPGVAAIGEVIAAAGNAAKEKADNESLDDLKTKLVSDIRDLGHRFIVTIDDVDRLEPKELIEVLRLVRSVADFPNVVYLLCYDSVIVSHSIENAAGVSDGNAYLEKIVQLAVMVPTPEPFELRHWFRDEVFKIASPKNDAERERLISVIDWEGGRQIKTPRSVVRTLDALRFFWPSLQKEGADLADLVWLLLIKDGNPKLYRWLEDYCATAAVISLGIGRVDDTIKKLELKRLLSIVADHLFDDLYYRQTFSDQLPGVDMVYTNEGDPFILFEHVGANKRDRAIQDRRLASPDHYRIYFALSGPSYALKQSEFNAFWKAVNNGSEGFGRLLLDWHLPPSDGLSKAEVLLERLAAMDIKILSPEQGATVLTALSEKLDDAFRQRPFERSFGQTSLWDRAKKLASILISRLPSENRKSVFKRMFEHGAAIGWLTSLLRREIFAQGRYGDQLMTEDKWVFKQPELDDIIEIMLARYRAMSVKAIMSSPDPASLFYAWGQAGDENGPIEVLKDYVLDDSNLVNVLETFSSSTASSEGTYRALRKESISGLLDYESARARINSIVESSVASEANLVERANRLRQAFIDGADF